MNEVDTVRAEAYMTCVQLAKNEHDELLPLLEKMHARVNTLKALIRAGSALVALPVEDKYQHKPVMSGSGSGPGPGSGTRHRT